MPPPAPTASSAGASAAAALASMPPPPHLRGLGRTQSLPAMGLLPPPPPSQLMRQRSFSSLSRPYRTTTGRYLSEHMDSVEEAVYDDIAEMVVNMHIQERDYYAPPLAYFQRLEVDPVLAQWRRGSVRWFSKVVQHLQANREIIATATNFLDRYIGAKLYPTVPAAATGAAAGGEEDETVAAASAAAASSFALASSSAPTKGSPPFSTPPGMGADAAVASGPEVVGHMPSMDQTAFEQIAVCALILGVKIQQGDSTTSVANRLANLTSCPLTPRALCEMEFRMMGALGRYLNPPTAGTLIHHLLHFLPEREKGVFLALDDIANDLALMALDTPGLVTFPVSVIAVSAILASFARLRSEGGGGEHLDPTLELRWLQTLDMNDLKVEPDEINDCLELLGRQAKKAAALPEGAAGGTMYLPHFLNPPSPKKGGRKASSAVPCTPLPCPGGKQSRAISPNGVAEIGLLESQAAALPTFHAHPYPYPYHHEQYVQQHRHAQEVTAQVYAGPQGEGMMMSSVVPQQHKPPQAPAQTLPPPPPSLYTQHAQHQQQQPPTFHPGTSAFAVPAYHMRM